VSWAMYVTASWKENPILACTTCLDTIGTARSRSPPAQRTAPCSSRASFAQSSPSAIPSWRSSR
jgi:hypothetical protein